MQICIGSNGVVFNIACVHCMLTFTPHPQHTVRSLALGYSANQEPASDYMKAALKST